MTTKSNICAEQVRSKQVAKSSMKLSPMLAIVLGLIALSIPACKRKETEAQEEQHKIVLTSPMARDEIITQPFVCQIRSQNHIDIQALANGFLEEIPIKEGQAVKEGQVLFQIRPVLYDASLNTEKAEVEAAEAEVNLGKLNTTKPGSCMRTKSR